MTEPESADKISPQERSADDVAIQCAMKKLQMEIEVQSAKTLPLRSSCFNATARTAIAHEIIYGFGTGASAEIAQRRAIMECAERYAQFECRDLPIAAVDTYASLEGRAISPVTCGLYSSAQYAVPGFGFAPFSKSEPLEWIEASNLLTGTRRLLPVEFIYPRMPLERRPLVAETSSGTAAHIRQAAATLAAVCEVIERDSLMLFWYRQPQTAAIPVQAIPIPELRNDLYCIQAMGFVVTVCHLDYDLEVPCFLIIAFKDDTFVYGLGCHPNWQQALEHAATELGRSLLWLQETFPGVAEYRLLPDVRTPEDHYTLYNRGPLHPVLRQVLAQVLRSVDSKDWRHAFGNMAGGDEQHILDCVLESIATRGYQAYVCDLTPTLLRDVGVLVNRVLVPGLIPIHFGYDRCRLGCNRLWIPGVPGRLSTLLPHFMT